MNINYKPSQIELFPSQGVELENIHRPRWLSASLSLSMESLVILSILGIMISLLSFALGVELGKRQVAQLMDDNVSVAWRVNARRAQAQAVAQKAAVPMATVIVHKQAVATKPVLGNNGFVNTKTVKPVVKTPESVKAQAPASALTNKRYTVQLGSYQNQQFAKEDALKLKAKGLTVFLIKSGKFWLLCAGQYANAQDAQKVSKGLPAKFRNSPVRRF